MSGNALLGMIGGPAPTAQSLSGFLRREHEASQAAKPGRLAGQFRDGLTALPYRVLGAPVDMLTMGLRPMGYGAADRDIVGGSEWMLSKAQRAGLHPGVPQTGAGLAGDLLGQVMTPGAGPGEAKAATAMIDPMRAMAASILAGPGAQKAAIGDLSPASYGISHRPPMRDNGAPLHDVTGGGNVYPDDVYGPNGAQYYGHGDPALDRATLRLVNSYRNNPDMMIPIYRAVPKGTQDSKINKGDWVTINRNYARLHGEGFDEGYDILEQRVPAKSIYTNGDSIHEWGYDPDE